MKLSIQTSKVNPILVLITVLLISSCASRQDIVYFQDEAITSAIDDQSSNFELRFKTDDLLTIVVSAQDPLVAQPFNLQATSTTTTVIDADGDLKMQTYLIDASGNIEFPVLGTLKIAGLTRGEANKMLKEKLSEYIVNPIVNIRLANFTVTILGEVLNPGTYTIQDERVSLNEALGLAGDLTIYGRRDNVLLIREIDGQKKYHKFNLTSINTVNSPNYYLTQNDVLYVEPNNARIRSSGYNQNNGIIISAIGTLATIVAILIR